jgi:hypothetical protein
MENFKDKAVVLLKEWQQSLGKECVGISKKIDKDYKNAYYFGYTKDYYASKSKLEFIVQVLDSGMLEKSDFEKRLEILKYMIFSIQRLDKEVDVLEHLNNLWCFRVINEIINLN